MHGSVGTTVPRRAWAGAPASIPAPTTPPTTASATGVFHAALTALFLVASLFAAAPLAVAQETPPADRVFSGRQQVTAVDLVVDVRDEHGNVPADLTPADFRVVEDGEEQTVIGVEAFSRGVTGGIRTVEETAPRPAAEPPPSSAAPPGWSWHTAIYFDQVLSSTGSIRRAARALSDQAGRLTGLGTVEILIADPFPRQVLAPTRSARLVEQTLLRVGHELGGRNAIRQIRRQFFDHLQTQGLLGGTREGTSAVAEINSDRFDVDRSAVTFQSVTQELILLNDQQDRLLVWAASHTQAGARALLLVNDGYDLDPRDFYLVGVDGGALQARIGGISADLSPQNRLAELSRTLAADGWVTVSLALGDLTGGFFGADVSGRGRLGNIAENVNQDATHDLPTQVMYRPLDPLQHLADETGGEVVTGGGSVAEALTRLGERVRVTYQVGRLPDGELHRVQVKPLRAGLRVKAPEWAGSPAPQALASARARRLLAGGVESGDLPVTAAVGLKVQAGGASEQTAGEHSGGERVRGTLQARLDLTALGPGALPPTSTLRVTFAVDVADQPPFVQYDVVRGQRLDGLDGWTYTVPVSLPPQAGKISVVVEELATGVWGGTLASRVSGELPPPPEGRLTTGVARGGGRKVLSAEEQGFDLPPDLLPDPKALVLVPPAGQMLTGGNRFETLITRPDVARVAFLVDSRQVAEAHRSPFDARIDLGNLPEPRTVEAVAYGADGTELGRDSLLVNEGAGTFRVRLIEPRRNDLMGPVNVEAEVRLRPDDALDRVEISWNDELVATLYEPPFRQRVQVPPESPVGFVAVTAFLADGSRCEDVIFMNGPGGDERLDVNLVELYTVVTDPTGRPIQGLGKSDFLVYEGYEPQTLSEVKDASGLPLSLGLLIDSSASMKGSMQDVAIAAVDFLFLTLKEGTDRAFLVDFDTEPRLVQPLTTDLEAVARPIVRLRAGGYTALCDALVYSLVQMRSVQGRRALVVLSDGVGREERVGYATCKRLAQQVGIPIYAIVLDPKGEERQRAASIEDVVQAVGGRVFYVSDLENLGEVYRTVRQELDSQYLLTYYPRPGGDDSFRHVAVEVRRPGLQVRSLAGYWP